METQESGGSLTGSSCFFIFLASPDRVFVIPAWKTSLSNEVEHAKHSNPKILLDIQRPWHSRIQFLHFSSKDLHWTSFFRQGHLQMGKPQESNLTIGRRNHKGSLHKTKGNKISKLCSDNKKRRIPHSNN
jgi:hypothetical protein